MKKRVLSVILAVLMILALMPVTALAHSGAKDKHSHDWKGGLFTYDDKIIVKTGDSSMGKIYQSEDDSKFNDGDTWHFQAQPGPEYEFVGWTFDNAYLVSSLSDANSPDLSFSYKYDLGFTVGSKFTAKANFDYKSCYSLSTNVSGNGSISKSPDKSLYRQNDQVTLTANADPGWEFTGWTGDVTDSAKTITVATNSNKSVTANFRALPTYTLNVNTLGEGTVSKDPDIADYWQGRNVKLTANPASGWRFGSWSGSASGTSNPITMSMDGNKDVTATFIKTYNITLNVDGPGKLDSKKVVAGTHDINSTINLDDAKPNANMTCKFIGWRDDATNDYVDSSTFTLTGDRSFTAVFGDREYLYTSAGPNGRLMNDLDGHRARGEEVNLNDAQPTPDAGYTLDCWKEYGYLWSGDGKVVTPIVTIGDSNWFKAYFKVADYKITYDLNGGTVSSNRSGYTYFDNTFTLNNPSKTGYIFAGWTGTGLSGLTSSVTIPKNSSGDRTYTANWTPITYTVAYDANGGIGSMIPSGYTYDVEQALAANIFYKVGCEFVGWAESSDGSVVYSNTQAVKNLTATDGAEVKLYAKWKVGGITVSGYDKAYDGNPHSVEVMGDLTDATVTYSTDGGMTYSGTKPEFTNVTAGVTVFVKVERSGAASFVDSATVKISKVPLTVTANNETVTFNDAPPAYSVNYSGFVAGDDETDLGGSLTFDSPYAIGSAVGTYSIMPSGLTSGNYDISFNPGTLTVDELILTVTFKDFDGTVLDTKQVVYGNAATAPAAPVREGYNFTGWDKTFDAVTGDITVTAQYAIKTYSVTFYQQDGVTPIGLPQTVNWGSAALFETAPAVVGSAFDQWVLTGSDASVTDSLTNVKENIKAVASYIRNGYTVTFVDYQGQVIGTAGVLYGEGAVAPVPPVREGYRFIGWDTSFDNVTGNMTVTAQYAINTYTVRFVNYNGDELSVQTVNWNTAATAPANPTRTGYTFTGWDTAFNAVTGDLVVTAQFRRNAVAAADADDDDDTQNGGTQNGGNTQNDGNQNAPANQQNGDQTLTDEPIPGTSDDGTATLEDESIPQAQSSVFPWWWILVILAAAGIIWFIIYKRRKDRAEAN